MCIHSNEINFDKIFGHNVKNFRRELNLSIDGFVSYLRERGVEVTPRTMYHIENGERHILLNEAFAISSALGVSIENLMVQSFTENED